MSHFLAIVASFATLFTIVAPLAAEPLQVDSAGRATVDIAWPAENTLVLTAPVPNITRAVLGRGLEQTPLVVEYNDEATQIRLHLPEKKASDDTASIAIETAKQSEQFADGRIVFSAHDAQVHGETAKLEQSLSHARIGFWTSASDYVTWQYQPTRPGTYQVELSYAKRDGEGTRVEVTIGKQAVEVSLPPTGSWYRYTAIPVGTVKLAGSEPITVKVRCLKLTGGAVMNLKAMTLRPMSEGTPPVQAEDGSVTCHARDVTIHGVKVQYEPQPHKNTVGYWVEPSDTVSWDLAIDRPGRFQVEILQGCGQGHGGSTVELHLAGQKLPFTVEDTGHFQNFVPRTLGTIEIEQPGVYRLEVRPVRKASLAVMDLRQVRLIPQAPLKDDASTSR